MRGREHPTVAAPRTWDEIEDPSFGTFASTKCSSGSNARRSARAARRNHRRSRQTDDLPAACAIAAKHLNPFRHKAPATGNDDKFVIQEHHARRLHYDFRLERDGVLVSWAVPKNLPDTPVGQPSGRAHRGPSTRIRDVRGHRFPKGEYGGGKVIIWDSGTYETEKFNDNPPDGPAKGGEVIITLHGEQDRRAVRADPDRRQELAGPSDEGPEAAHRRGSRADALFRGLRAEAQEDAVGVRG